MGLLGEQASESKHASVNAELRSLASVRNHSEKLQLVLQREELRSSMNKSLIKCEARICTKCSQEDGRRHFLRCAKNGKRCCPFCDSDNF